MPAVSISLHRGFPLFQSGQHFQRGRYTPRGRSSLVAALICFIVIIVIFLSFARRLLGVCRCGGQSAVSHMYGFRESLSQARRESSQLMREKCDRLLGQEAPEKDWSTASVRGRLHRVTNVSEYGELMDLIGVVHQVLTAHGIPYIIYSGTLLGSYFFHDIIPWDDDVDILAPKRHEKSIASLLSDVEFVRAEHVLNDDASNTATFIRVYYDTQSKLSNRLHNSFWTFPFVDIALYHENSTHIWDTLFPSRCFPVGDVFPVHQRPLGHLWLFAPHNPYGFLTLMFRHRFVCETGSFDHKLNRFRSDQLSEPCDNVAERYPVVIRRPLANGGHYTTERLVMWSNTAKEGKHYARVIYKCILPEISYGSCERPLTFSCHNHVTAKENNKAHAALGH